MSAKVQSRSWAGFRCDVRLSPDFQHLDCGRYLVSPSAPNRRADPCMLNRQAGANTSINPCVSPQAQCTTVWTDLSSSEHFSRSQAQYSPARRQQHPRPSAGPSCLHYQSPNPGHRPWNMSACHMLEVWGQLTRPLRRNEAVIHGSPRRQPDHAAKSDCRPRRCDRP